MVRRSERNPNKLTIDVLIAEGNVKSLRFGNEIPEGRFVLDYEKERCSRYEEKVNVQTILYDISMLCALLVK